MKQVPKEINGVRVVKISDAYVSLINPRAKGNRKLAYAVMLTLAGGSEVLFCQMCGQFYADDDLSKSGRSMASHLSHHTDKRKRDEVVPAETDLLAAPDLSAWMASIGERLSQATSAATGLAKVLVDVSASLSELIDNLPDIDAETVRKAEKYDQMRELMD